MTIARLIHRIDSVLNVCESWLINLPFFPQVVILALVVGICAVVIAYFSNTLLFKVMDIILGRDKFREENLIVLGEKTMDEEVIVTWQGAISKSASSDILHDEYYGYNRNSIFNE